MVEHFLLSWSIILYAIIRTCVGDQDSISTVNLNKTSEVHMMGNENETVISSALNSTIHHFSSSSSSEKSTATMSGNVSNIPRNSSMETNSIHIMGHSFANIDSGAIYRGLLVVAGISTLVIGYFLVRAIRLRKKRNRGRRYGVLGREERHELAPLDRDDDEEEDTMFDVSQHGQR